LGRLGLDDPLSLMETLDLSRQFLLPVFESLTVGEELKQTWTPAGEWAEVT